MSATAQRYTAVAIVLHWAIAFALVFMIPLGFWMHIRAEAGDTSRAVFDGFQLHKSIGLTILALSLVRLGWRLANPPPPLPTHMPAWEKLAAKATHWAFYAIMIGMPLSGWLYVSAGWSIHDDAPLAVPTHWFGLFQVPALFGLPQASAEVRADAAEAAFTAHWVMAYAAIGLAVLHVSAAMKHHAFDRDEVLAHMVPGLRAPFEKEAPPRSVGRLAVLGVGLGLTTIATCAALFAVANLGSSAPAAQAQPPSTIEIAAPNAPSTAAPDPAALPGAAAPAAVPSWRIDQRSSSIRFGYEYIDESGETHFDGRFARWSADIRFDPNNLEQSSVVVRIETASASTGVAAHDGALPGSGWFNASAFPTATFRTTRIRSRGEGRYEARGNLTIRGETKSVDLPFTLAINGNQASMSGTTTIDRRDFNIGDPGAGDDLISGEIDISVRVDATRSP